MKRRNVRFCGAGALLRKRRHAETSCSKALHQAVRRIQARFEWAVHLGGELESPSFPPGFPPPCPNGLPSSDMGMLLSPLLRVQRLRRVQARSIRLFVVLGDAPNKLYVSRGVRIPPSNPGTPQHACILRGAPFGLSSPVSYLGAVLASCGTDFTSLLTILISHQHNQA